MGIVFARKARGNIDIGGVKRWNKARIV